MNKISKTSLLIAAAIALAGSLSSAAQAASVKTFNDRNSMYDLRMEFFSIGRNLGFLEANNYLSDEDKKELQGIKQKSDALRGKFKSELTKSAWASTDSNFLEGTTEGNSSNVQLSMGMKVREGSVLPMLAHAYQCQSSNRSMYVDRLNNAFHGLNLSLYRLEKLLPMTVGSGMLMMTQNDYTRIEGKTRLCLERDQATNTVDITKMYAVPVAPVKEKVRIPPYSVSRKQQHEMVCSSLHDARIPPPFGAQCLFNYK